MSMNVSFTRHTERISVILMDFMKEKIMLPYLVKLLLNEDIIMTIKPMKDFILQHINPTRKASFRNCFCYIALRHDNESTDYRLRTTDNRLRTTDYGQQTTSQRDN